MVLEKRTQTSDTGGCFILGVPIHWYISHVCLSMIIFCYLIQDSDVGEAHPVIELEINIWGSHCWYITHIRCRSSVSEYQSDFQLEFPYLVHLP